VTIGATSMRQRDDYLRAAGVELTRAEIEAMDKLAPPAITYPHWIYLEPTDPVHKAMKIEGRWPAIESIRAKLIQCALHRSSASGSSISIE
jgi:hypothetical protein